MLLLLLASQILTTPIAKVDFKKIDEMSGIAKSRTFEDTYWVHNDSGDKARIFAIHANGKSIKPSWDADYKGLRINGAKNVDWEDIALDGQTLYISDLGNNGNKRQDLTIYVLPEPNPNTMTEATVTKTLRVKYPDQTAFPPTGKYTFDCEAIFVLHGKIFVISKDRLNRLLPATTATLYRLDTDFEDKVNVLTKVDSATGLRGWVTGADVSPDGKTLAVLTHFPRPAVYTTSTSVANDQFFTAGKWVVRDFLNLGQCEAICFENNSSMIVGNEGGSLFRVKV
ncbi:hypothetical protein BH11ARM1_BH11ARM1_10130 [soil metagenome]